MCWQQRSCGRSVNRLSVEALERRVLLSVFTVTNTNDFGPGSLRDAITQAESVKGGLVDFDTSVFAPARPHTIALITQLGVFKSVRIDGPGPDSVALTITRTDGLIGVDTGATLTLHGIALTGAKAPALINQGTTTVDDCRFEGNTGLEGAAILNQNILTVTDCTFSGNSNGALGGGAVANLRGSTAVVFGSTFVNNTTNQATGLGGAIFNQGTMVVEDSTFTGNSAQQASGGAIWNARAPGPAGKLTVTNCTVTGNSSASGGAIAGGAFTLNNSIVAGNTVAGSATPSDLGGITTGSNNLIGTGGSGGLTDGVNGNLVGVTDPKLGVLADNGGPTMTIALLPGSPAIDSGSNAVAVDAVGNPLLIDQRGDARVVNGTVDIGAYESDSTPYRLPGDGNNDGKVDFADLIILAQEFNVPFVELRRADFNHDGKTDFSDLLILVQNYGKDIKGATAADLLSLTSRKRG